MLIKVGAHFDAGETIKDVIVVPDHATDEEIETEAKEWVWDYIDLWWERDKGTGKSEQLEKIE